MEQKVTVQSADKVKIQRPSKKGGSDTARNRIYVRDVKGGMEYFRRSWGFILLAVFALIPWLTYNGQQAVLLDIMEQRFRIYGLTLWPQDFTVLAWFAIVAAVALFFVTTIWGRVWCGFVPTNHLDFIFMWFEESLKDRVTSASSWTNVKWTLTSSGVKPVNNWVGFQLRYSRH